MAHSSNAAPPARSSGADQLSSTLIPSVPLMMIATCRSQKAMNAMALP
jgi:hypothetical protein